MPNTPFSATAEGMRKFDPRPLFVEMTPALRQQLEDTVEHLIWILDTLQDNPDFENDNTAEEEPDGELNGDDEPDLGWTNNIMQSHKLCGGTEDLELDTCDFERQEF